MTQNVRQLGLEHLLTQNLTEVDVSKFGKNQNGRIQSLIEEIRELADIKSDKSLLLTASPPVRYGSVDEISLFSGETTSDPESEGIMPADMKELRDTLAEIQNMMRESKELDKEITTLKEEEAALWPEVLDTLLRDHPKKNVLKELLTPK